jgi:hypothetical protein
MERLRMTAHTKGVDSVAQVYFQNLGTVRLVTAANLMVWIHSLYPSWQSKSR